MNFCRFAGEATWHPHFPRYNKEDVSTSSDHHESHPSHIDHSHHPFTMSQSQSTAWISHTSTQSTSIIQLLNHPDQTHINQAHQHLSITSIEHINRTHQSNTSIEHINRTHQSNTSIEHINRTPHDINHINQPRTSPNESCTLNWSKTWIKHINHGHQPHQPTKNITKWIMHVELIKDMNQAHQSWTSINHQSTINQSSINHQSTINHGHQSTFNQPSITHQSTTVIIPLDHINHPQHVMRPEHVMRPASMTINHIITSSPLYWERTKKRRRCVCGGGREGEKHRQQWLKATKRARHATRKTVPESISKRRSTKPRTSTFWSGTGTFMFERTRVTTRAFTFGPKPTNTSGSWKFWTFCTLIRKFDRNELLTNKTKAHVIRDEGRDAGRDVQRHERHPVRQSWETALSQKQTSDTVIIKDLRCHRNSSATIPRKEDTVNHHSTGILTSHPSGVESFVASRAAAALPASL